MLEQQPNLAGVEFSQISESFPKVDVAVAELVAANAVTVLRFREDGPRILFRRPLSTPLAMDSSLKSLWNSFAVPRDPSQIIDALHKGNI